MRGQREARLVAIASTVVLVASVPSVRSSSSAETANAAATRVGRVADTRQTIQVSAAQRDAMRLEMRTMLQSMSAVLQGLIAGDLDMVQQSARAAGGAAAPDPGLGASVPVEFRQLSARTHKRFDDLADSIRGGPRDAVLKRLAAIAASCVLCHDTYRLDQPGP